MLGAVELHPRPSVERDGWSVRRHDELRRAALALAALLALAGCGGSSDDKGGEGRDGNLVVAALGDSITAGSPLWDPDPAVRESEIADPDERSQFEYWAERAKPALEFRNCGVFGERTDELATRLSECAASADVLLLQGGINDIAQGRGVESAIVSIQRTIDAAQEMGLRVVLVDVLPWNNAHPQADAAIESLNRAIDATAKQENVEALPFHDTLEDPRSPGTMRPKWTIDGDHPSVEGYRLLGGLVASRLGVSEQPSRTDR